MAHTEWQVHQGDDYIQILPADGHTEEPLADIFGGIEVARLMAAAPELQRMLDEALGLLESHIDTPGELAFRQEGRRLLNGIR